ncbi:gp427 [Bacillus phage G]|uniref:Gp427 n=1 Tax=Bacillus phage G TaxID=2884420 RepID=G3MAG8_9CAUD|nr:gp427 [Bacillus phage G]AEO93685.1 gp427 [Bacillus phage G]
MVKYYYERFTANASYAESSSVENFGITYIAAAYKHERYSFDTINNKYNVVSGTHISVGDGLYLPTTMYAVSSDGTTLDIYELQEPDPASTEATAKVYWSRKSTSRSVATYSKGNLVQSNIVAEDGNYPTNGRHTDGYWYVRGAQIIPETITTELFTTLGNNKRKLVRLPNGWLVSAVAGADSTNKNILVSISKDNGNTWQELWRKSAENPDVALVVIGSDVGILYGLRASIQYEVYFRKFKSDTSTFDNDVTIVNTVQTISQNTLTAYYDKGSNNLHVAWSQYNNGYNLAYSKSNNKGLSFSSYKEIVNVGDSRYSATYPYITSVNGNLKIFYKLIQTNQYIMMLNSVDNGETFSNPSTVHSGGVANSSRLSSPSAVVDQTNRLHLVYSDGENGEFGENQTPHIIHLYSNNGGANWTRASGSAPLNLYNNQEDPSIAVDKRGYVYIAGSTDGGGVNASVNLFISKDRGETWGNVIKISDKANYPSLMQDDDFVGILGDIPPMIYVSNDTTRSIKFKGTYTVEEAPTMPGTFTQPTGTLEIGDSKVVSWGTSNDVNGNLSKYILEVSINGGSWTQIGTPTTNTFNYTIPTATSIKFRVKAQDTAGLESGYRESSVFTVTDQMYYWSKYNSVKNEELNKNDLNYGTIVEYSHESSYSDTISKVIGAVWNSIIKYNENPFNQPPYEKFVYTDLKIVDGQMTLLGESLSINSSSTLLEMGKYYYFNSYNGIYAIKTQLPEASAVVDRSIHIYSLSPSGVISYTKGSLVQSNIQSIYNAYQNDARNPDGYWYVRGSRVSQTISPPGVFNIPLENNQLKHSQPVTITFGASSASNLSLYEVDYRYNGAGNWLALSYNNTLTRSLTITSDKSLLNIQFRVRAKDTNNIYSDYVYSDTILVDHNNAPTQPGDFVKPTGVLEIGDSKVFIAGMSIDIDGNLSKYVWEVSLNNGAYSIVGESEIPSFTYIIPSSTSLRMRVKAVDSKGASSGYRESEVYTVVKAKYFWTKYNVVQISKYQHDGFATDTSVTLGTGGTHGNDFAIDENTGQYSLVGETKQPSRLNPPKVGEYIIFVIDGYLYKITSVGSISADSGSWPNSTWQKAKIKTTTFEGKGTPIETNIIAEEGTYPVDGKHTDGFWYVRGAKVTSLVSSVVIDDKNYKTAPNYGRKLIRLDSGTLIAAAWSGTSTTFGTFKIRKSLDNGNTWITLRGLSLGANGATDVALATDGIKIFILYIRSVAASNVHVTIDIMTESGEILKNVFPIDTGQYEIRGISIAVDRSNGHAHAIWASKNATYPNSFNLRYSKSTDGGQTWSTVEQKTAHNTVGREVSNPSVVVNNGEPIIAAEFAHEVTGNYIICFKSQSNSPVYSSASYIQINPSLTADKDGVLHAVWNGRNPSFSRNNIFYSKSMDNGISWSNAINLTNDSNNNISASITSDKTGKLYVAWHNNSLEILSSVFDGTTWSVGKRVMNGISGTNFPSTLYDSKFNVIFGEFPPLIYTDLNSNNISYVGSYETSDIPTIKLLSPEDNQVLYENDTFKISGNVNDADSDQSVTVYYQINNIQKTLTTVASGNENDFFKELIFKDKKLYDQNIVIVDDLVKDTPYSLKVWSVDSSGFVSEVAERSFRVMPNNAPILVVNEITPSGIINSDKFTISGNVSDVDENPNITVSYKINQNEKIEVYNGSGDAWEFEVSLSQLKSGENDISIEAIDNYFTKTIKTVKLNKNEVNVPILESVARYKLDPPKGSARGILLFIQKDEQLNIEVEISMTDNEQEDFVLLVADNTVPVANKQGIVESTYHYEVIENKSNIILKISATKQNADSNHKIHLISGVVE